MKINEWIVIGLIILVLAGAVLAYVIIKNKKQKLQAEQPIHKDYDPSIEGAVKPEEQPVSTVETTTVQQTPVQEEVKEEPELSFESKPDMPQLTGESPATVQTPVMTEPTPIAEPVVAPTIPEVPTISEPVTTPVVEQQPVVVDATPIMDIPTTPVVENSPVVNNEPVVVPTVPQTDMPVIETPTFTNVGTVAEPVIEMPTIETPTPVVEEVVQVVEEPVQIVEEPAPQVAQTADVQVLDNYEIKLPEEEKTIEISQNMNEQNITKAPMFVTDIQVETPVVEQPVQQQPITIDVPEVEEIQ